MSKAKKTQLHFLIEAMANILNRHYRVNYIPPGNFEKRKQKNTEKGNMFGVDIFRGVLAKSLHPVTFLLLNCHVRAKTLFSWKNIALTLIFLDE